MTRQVATGPEHIVVATDFSAGADVAVRRAAALAQGRQVPLRLVHVRKPSSAASDEGASQRLDDLAHQVQDRAGVEVESTTIEGRLESSLAALAGQEDADLVVIGRDSASILRRLLRGATSMRCLRALELPLLITRDEDLPGYERLLLPLDFNAAGRAALRLARQWFPQAELHVLHVLVPELEPAPMEMPWSATAAAAHEPTRAAAAAGRLAAWLKDNDYELPASRLHIATGPVPQATADAAERLDAQLIIAASDCDGRLGSIVAGLAAEGERDILLLNCSRMRVPA